MSAPFFRFYANIYIYVKTDVPTFKVPLLVSLASSVKNRRSLGFDAIIQN